MKISFFRQKEIPLPKVVDIKWKAFRNMNLQLILSLFTKEIYGEIELQILIPTERAMGMFVKDNIGDGISRGYSHAIIEETLKKTYLDNLKNKGTL